MSAKEKNNIEDGKAIWKTLKKPHNACPLGGALLIVLLVIVSQLSGEGNLEVGNGNLIKNLGIELAFALFIAVFLSVSIEEFTRRQFHKDMNSRITDIQKMYFAARTVEICRSSFTMKWRIYYSDADFHI